MSTTSQGSESKETGTSTNIGSKPTENISEELKRAIFSQVSKYAQGDDFKKNIQESTGELIRSSEDKLSSKIDDSKLKIIETLGIFVALFTFISVEFQIFRVYSDILALLGLSLILLGSLAFFILLLHILLNNKEISWKLLVKKIEVSLPLLLILFGSIFISISPGRKDVETTMEKMNSIEVKNLLYKDSVNSTNIISVDDLLYKNDIDISLERNNQINTEILNCLQKTGYFTKKCFEIQR